MVIINLFGFGGGGGILGLARPRPWPRIHSDLSWHSTVCRARYCLLIPGTGIKDTHRCCVLKVHRLSPGRGPQQKLTRCAKMGFVFLGVSSVAGRSLLGPVGPERGGSLIMREPSCPVYPLCSPCPNPPAELRELGPRCCPPSP